MFSGFLTFYQFIASNRGASLADMLSLGGQPTPQIWDHYDNWWITTRAQMSVESDPNNPDWAVMVMWKSKAFMNEFWSLSNTLSKNPFVLSLEQIIWSLGHMSQVNPFEFDFRLEKNLDSKLNT